VEAQLKLAQTKIQDYNKLLTFERTKNKELSKKVKQLEAAEGSAATGAADSERMERLTQVNKDLRKQIAELIALIDNNLEKKGKKLEKKAAKSAGLSASWADNDPVTGKRIANLEKQNATLQKQNRSMQSQLEKATPECVTELTNKLKAKEIEMQMMRGELKTLTMQVKWSKKTNEDERPETPMTATEQLKAEVESYKRKHEELTKQRTRDEKALQKLTAELSSSTEKIRSRQRQIDELKAALKATGGTPLSAADGTSRTPRVKQQRRAGTLDKKAIEGEDHSFTPNPPFKARRLPRSVKGDPDIKVSPQRGYKARTINKFPSVADEKSDYGDDYATDGDHTDYADDDFS
jgi:predicted  nucleic acid-binding Zn-ribbon protein